MKITDFIDKLNLWINGQPPKHCRLCGAKRDLYFSVDRAIYSDKDGKLEDAKASIISCCVKGCLSIEPWYSRGLTSTEKKALMSFIAQGFYNKNDRSYSYDEVMLGKEYYTQIAQGKR